MKNICIIVLAVICAALSHAGTSTDLKLWYQHPAQEWVESLPIGNGRLLATNQGGVRREIIQLNEDTVWSGHPEDKDNPGGAEALPEVRKLLFEGKYKKAQELVHEKMMTPHHAHGVQTYQTLGGLNLIFDYGDRALEATEYRRELDLDRAVSNVSFKMGDATYTRELFSSPVDQAIIVRLTCDKPGRLNFDAAYKREQATIEAVSNNRLVISGQATDKGNDLSGGVIYEAQIQFMATGGRLSKRPDGIRVEHADSVELRIVAGTDYHGEDPHAVCEKQLAAIKDKAYAALLKDHVAEHQRLFRRVELNLVYKKQVRGLKMARIGEMPTDQQLEAYRQGTDVPGLVELYFHFGRYILISCSRPGTQAINLWGKWVHQIDPSYNADYHTNINIPMNYWPAQVCNLGECNEPFFDLIDELRPKGRISAKVTYDCDGFVAHHATDAWRFSAAVGRATHGMWVLTPAWGAHQMWQYYLFGGDREYLAQKSYPIMKEAADFFVDYLVESPKSGYLVSGPACSPENTFIAENGQAASISMGPTMDMQMIADLFSNCIEASNVLGVDEPFRKKLEELQVQLQPMQIGRDGRLMEWAEPFTEQQPGHKHCSHLWGACEADLITPSETPELAAAALKSLDFRVENGSAITPVFRGNTAWIVQSYVRLLEGDKAYDILRYMIGSSSYPNLFSTSVQGLRREMWETDANLGNTLSIAEMFMQSHAGAIHLLPALPTSLADGNVKGLRARGGFEVGLDWANGTLKSATIKSLQGEACKLKYGEQLLEFKTEAGRQYRFDGSLREQS
ncbi:glycoside hydrolase family 95 protein [Pontiella sulfatireligans]|uniref:Uncharacterized protein n=1 Tax=Pontiella sulfatireligans TaxID=2750658 RepID=A0A6C2UF36_9BACT|nr:glycoside hydrolase family 95 protein [Pontiella sulfatireligans]VGO18728.1 hypothetical protein SCARR_00781 [Pontiella sulfatireligans]